MEENRVRLRRKTILLLLFIFVAITIFMLTAYFIQNYLEQRGIVNDTQLERGITTLLFCFFWSVVSFQLYKNITRAFDQRSQVFDDQEARIHATQEASRLREQFMANMSHEIRTPLNAIIAFSAILNRENLNTHQKELSANILTASENLLTIVNDILDLSKIEAGMITLENIPFELSDLFHVLQQMFAEKAREKKLVLDFDLAPNMPELLIGDPTRLSQILINLINNALKFTERGSVTVRANFSKKNSKEIDLRLEVQDSGIGIAKDKIEQMFERFIQADSNTTRMYGGTGLGLAIVKQLVKTMRGSINVESRLGKGTTITVILPVLLGAPGSEKTAPLTTKPQIDSDLAHLLVVEDNPMNQRVIQLLFEEWQLPFTLAENGRRAVEILEKTPTAFDLILMDIQMPEMDGYETTRYIRQNLKLNVPVVAMTAHVLTGERDKCLRLGMNDYISKPIREQELREIIQRYVDRPDSALLKPQIDLAYLQETFGNDPEQLRELAGIFLEQVPKEIDAIATALATADFAAVAKIAHSMKSTVGYMGFAESIGQLLSQFEQDCQGNIDPNLLECDFERIRKAVDFAIEQVLKTFPSTDQNGHVV